MKRFLVHLVPFVALQCAIGAFFLAHYRPSPDHILASAADKQRLLATAPSPRLVMIGGSNVSFTLDCDTLAARLPYHPIDMGIHAGLGAGYILNESRDGLRPGDVAVVSIEYEQFGITTQPEVLLRLLASNPGSVRHVPLDDWPALLDYGLSYTGIVVRNALDGLRGREELLVQPYTRGALNEYGDVELRTPITKAPPVGIALLPDGRLPRRFGAVVEKINDFADRVRARGVRVYFAHPVVPETRWRLHGAEFARVEEALSERMRVPMLEPAGDAVLPDSLFYDTEYHLGREGVALRTSRLAAAIARRLAAEAPREP